MSKCPTRRLCSALRRVLRQLDADAVPPEFSCTGQYPCSVATDTALQIYHAINPENVELVGEAIRRIFRGTLPIDRSTVAMTLALRKAPFVCPEIGIEIRQPCTVQSCTFWTPNTFTRNCIVYYMQEYDRDGLDLKELTILLGDATGSVRKRINDVIAQTQHHALLLKTRQVAQEIPAPETLLCPTCGNAVEQAVMQGGQTYCSEACVPLRPPLELALEQEFKLPIDRILDVCLNNFFALRHMCHALNVTTKQFFQLCEDHHIDVSILA